MLISLFRVEKQTRVGSGGSAGPECWEETCGDEGNLAH